jgi:ATP-dependent helicase/nuclease subunit A
MSVLTDYQKAALEYKKHISLTANAGSGKTTVLSKRYVEILINENISINNIVAITFTEKAASELYSKIASELDTRISNSTRNQRYRLETLRRSLVSAKISTIHSFCIDILKDYAPEAGIDANFSPIDARTASDLLDQSFNEAITANLLSDSPSMKNLIRIFSNKSQLISKVKQLFNKRKSTERLTDTYYKGNTKDIAEWINSNFEHMFEELFNRKIKILIQNVVVINNIAESFKQSEKQIEINRLLNELKTQATLIDKFILLNEIRVNILTQKGDVAKRGYLSTELYSENVGIIDETTTLFKDLKDIEIADGYEKLNANLAKFGKEIIDFYNEISERYANKKQQKSYLDFEDLLLLTQDLITNSEVKNALSEKYKYIMIDEYQDTNETQYNIFMPILKNLSTGNLFVVGDEKQSIYMFREAEVELFNLTKKEIEIAENETSILDLPHSFRLAPNIALFTNLLFRRLFKDPNPQFNEVAYNELVCAYPNSSKGKIELILSDEENATEAELVSRKILQLIENSEYDYKFQDITVLCTKRKIFLELGQVFTEFCIPFSIVGGKGYYQQQLIYDIYNYLSFLINPINDLALATILRAPYYGLSDVQLTKILLSDGNSLIEKIKHFPEFGPMIKLIEEHLYDAKILRPNELIRKINTDTGYWAYISSKSNAVQEIANLEKLIQKSIYITEQGFHTLFDFVNYLYEAINNIEDEGQADLDSGDDAVKIMTIHQSKGLEFKVVILFKTNQKTFDEKLKTKEITVDKNFGILSKLPVDNNYFEEYKQAPIIGIYNYIQKKKSIAESKRLLYVAITRAEQHLIITAGLKKEKIWPDSFASMILGSLSIKHDETKITLNDDLTFMRFNDGEYSLAKEELEMTISIENNIEYSDNIKKESGQEALKEYHVNINNIQSSEKNEIISASKISLFLNCPRKYELTYEFGYGELTKFFRDKSDFEFSYKEDEINIPGNTVGSVAHSILEKNIPIAEIENEAISLIDREESVMLLSNKEKEKLIKEISELINKFYNSESYKYLNKFIKSYNEIEFYKRESNYYLYGIIDKLIVDNDKIIVVDYKSDRVNDNNVQEKRDTYLNQLFFYSYIIINQYPKIIEFELWLVFLRDDKFSVTKNVFRDEVKKFGNEIRLSVEKIRSKDFSDSEKGCKNMQYYLLNE